LLGRIPIWLKRLFRRAIQRIQPEALAAGLNTEADLAKRDKGMTALNKSRMA